MEFELPDGYYIEKEGDAEIARVKGRYVLKSKKDPSFRQVLKGVTTPISQYYRDDTKDVSAYDKLRSERAMAKGTSIHAQVSEWINNKSTPRSAEAWLATQNLQAKYKPSEGWRYKADIPVTDLQHYASEIDILAYNERTRQAVIIDLKTGKASAKTHSAQLTIYAQMWNRLHPDMKITDTEILHTNERFEKTPWKSYPATPKAEIKDIFYSGPLKKFAHRFKSTAHIKNLDTVALENAHIGDPFRYSKRVSAQGRYSKDSYTVLDIETGGKQEPVAVTAIKYVRNLDTGEWEVQDTFERYYKFKEVGTGDYYKTQAVHGLTPEIIKKLRHEQRARYSPQWNEKERKSLLRFIGQESKVIGHNIWGGGINPGRGFDLKNLFSFEQVEQLKRQGGILDTLMLFEDLTGETKGQGLSDLFIKYYGKSMEEADLSHHDAMSDVIATMMVIQAAASENTQFGKMVRASLLPGITYTGFNEFDVFRYKGDIPMTSSEIERLQDKANQAAARYESKAEDGGMIRVEGDHPARPWMQSSGSPEDFIKEIKELVKIFKGSEAETAASMSNTYFLQNVSSMTETMREMALTRNLSNTQRMISWARKASMSSDSEKYLRSLGLDKETEEAVRSLIPRQREQSIDEALQALSEKAEETGTSGWYKEYIDVFGRPQNADDVSDMRVAFKKAVRLQKEIEKAERREDRFFAGQHKILSDYAAYGYTPADLEGIAKAVDEDQLGEALAQFKFEQRQRSETLKAIKEGDTKKATAISHATSQLDLDKIAEAATNSVEPLNNMTAAVNKVTHALNQLPTESYQNVLRMQQHYVDSVVGAAQGVVPKFLLRPANRFAQATMNFARANYAPIQWKWDVLHGVTPAITAAGAIGGAVAGTAIGSMIAPGVGTAVGGIIGAGAGAIGGIGNAVEYGATYFQNKRRQKELTQIGEAITGRINFLGGIVDIVATPFKVLGTVTKSLTHNLRSLTISVGSFTRSFLSQSWDLYNNLGSPLTPLTGVTYEGFEKASYIDRLTGRSIGTTNSAYEAFAQAQQNMYWRGQFDQGRLVASSLLGVYGDVYANGGNTESQYNNMVNTLYRRIRGADVTQRQFILGQASAIDSQLPQILSYMERVERYLGRSVTYEELQRSNTWSVYKRDLTQEEEDRFVGYRMERSIIKDSINNTKMRFGGLIWDRFGRDIMDTFNKKMDEWYAAFANSNFLKGMDKLWDDLKNRRWDEVWGDLRAGVGSISKLFEGFNVRINWGSTFEKIGTSIEKVFLLINDGWWTLLQNLTKSFASFIDYVNTIEIDTDAVRKMLKGEKDYGSIVKIGYDKATTREVGLPQYFSGSSWFNLPEARSGFGNSPVATYLQHTVLGGADLDEFSILGKSFRVKDFKNSKYNADLQAMIDARTGAIQDLMNVAKSNGWFNSPNKVVAWMNTSSEGRNIRNLLFPDASEWEEIQQRYQPAWLSPALSLLQELKTSTDELIENSNVTGAIKDLIDRLINAFSDIKIEVTNNLNVSGDAQKTGPTSGSIPNLLSFNLQGTRVGVTGGPGDLSKALTKNSTGGY